MAQVEHGLEIDAPGARELLERDENALLVDVRGEDEWANGYIPGAVLVPLRDLRPDLRAPDSTPIAACIAALEGTTGDAVRPFTGSP